MSKLEAVREILNEFGYSVNPKIIIKILADRGITVTFYDVQNGKYYHRHSKKKVNSRKAISGHFKFTIEYVQNVGSVDKAIRLLQEYKKMI